jgi:ABC-type branched-subunit amino acid transport system ATPase component
MQRKQLVNLKEKEERPILKIRNLTKRFGGLVALDNCSFDVEENAIVGLIGPNGSGKTTLLNLVNGYYKIDCGYVYFKGSPLNGLKTYQIARKGIGRTSQIVKVFKKMTVLENMLAGVPEWLSLEEMKEKAIELLKFFDLIQVKDNYGEGISYGQQKLLEFARALMPDPELILLDEPVAGINPGMISKLLDYIRKLRDMGKTFLVVEHNMPVIMGLCDKIVVLAQGKKIAEGTPKEIRNDERVIEAYLGE